MPSPLQPSPRHTAEGQQVHAPLYLKPLTKPVLLHDNGVPPTRREHVGAVVSAIALTLSFVCITGYATYTHQTIGAVAAPSSLVSSVAALVPADPDPFTDVHISARAAVVYDLTSSSTLFGAHETEPLPLASVTKLMTVLAASEVLPHDASVPITAYALSVEGDSGFVEHERWRIDDLASYTLLSSSNDGAEALAVAGGYAIDPSITNDDDAERTFIRRMNARAQELGLSSLTFHNASGLDESATQTGGVGSAIDVARLAAHLYSHDQRFVQHLSESTHTYVSQDGIAHRGENTNDIVYRIPGLLVAKTGYTDLAGGNLAVLYDAGLGQSIAIVVLGGTRESRFNDVRVLIDATYRYLSSGWYAYEHARPAASPQR